MKKVVIIVCVLLFMLMPLVSAYSKYDVNYSTSINVQDATECWSNRGSSIAKYDVNSDNSVNVRDATEIWAHKGEASNIPQVIIDWIVDNFGGLTP